MEIQISHLVVIITGLFVGFVTLGYLIYKLNSEVKSLKKSVAFEKDEQKRLAEFFLSEGVDTVVTLERLRFPEDGRLRGFIFQKLSKEMYSFLSIVLEGSRRDLQFVPLLEYMENLEDFLGIFEELTRKMNPSQRGDIVYREFVEFYINAYGEVSAKELERELLSIEVMILDTHIPYQERQSLFGRYADLMKNLGDYFQRISIHFKRDADFVEMDRILPRLKEGLEKTS